jgi:hypothetical protein
MKSIFKTPENTRFLYIPRFYDERKEELDDIVAQNQPDEQPDADKIKERILRKMRNRYYGRSQFAKKAIVRSRVMVFGIAVFLLLISLLIIRGFPF